MLPPPGTIFAACLAAIPVVRDNDLVVFCELLKMQLRQMAGRGHPWLLVALHERDRLLPMARCFRVREYVTSLYIVHWPNEAPDIDRLLQRVPYLELGAL
jgi:hypothetical protein